MRTRRLPADPRRRVPRARFALLALLAAGLMLLATAPAGALHVATGPSRTIVTAEARLGSGLSGWPDGPMGIERSPAGRVFYAANKGDIARTLGTLRDPIALGTWNIRVQGARTALNDLGYAGGGPIYRDPDTGMRLMFLHLERYPTGDASDGWYGTIGLARSTDAGRTWTFLGQIFSHNISYRAYRASPGRCGIHGGTAPYGVVNTGSGQFVEHTSGGRRYFYVYAPDTQAPSGGHCRVNLAVMRAPVRAVVEAASAGTTSPWRKYHAGSWSEPARGGRSTDLDLRERKLSFDVSYDRYLNRYLLVVPHPLSRERFALDLLRSRDGVSWSKARRLFAENGELYAPTIAGSGGDPRVTGRNFRLLYGSSPRVGSRERRLHGRLVSREIELSRSR